MKMKTWKLPLIAVLFVLFQSQVIRSVPEADADNDGMIINSNTDTTLKQFKIDLTLSNLDDLKVKEGDTITVGQIISDRSSERSRLNAERREILLAIAKIEQTPQPVLKPVIPPQELPAPSYETQEAAIQQAELKFAQARQNYNNALSVDPFIRVKANIDFARVADQQAYREVELQQKKIDAISQLKGLPPEVLEHETEKLQQKLSEWEKKQAEYDYRSAEYKQVEQERKQEIALLQSKVEEARSELEAAQARLRDAQQQRRQLEYQHSITVAQHNDRVNQSAIALSQQNLEREFKMSQLKERLRGSDEKIDRIAVVRSPYSGRVQRVKTEGQSDNTIRVTVTLVPSEVNP